MLRLAAALFVLVALTVSAVPTRGGGGRRPIVVAQEQKPSLWDLLFGDKNKQKPEPPPVEAPKKPSSPSITVLEPPKPQGREVRHCHPAWRASAIRSPSI